MTYSGSSSSASEGLTRRLAAPGIHAIILDIVGSVLGLSAVEVEEIGQDRRLDADDLGVDSLQLIELATDVTSLFCLDEIGNEDRLLQRRSLADWTETVLEALAYDEHPGLRMQTSGSTGTPRVHLHRWSELQQEIHALAELFNDRKRIVAMVPRHHIYGLLFSVMLPTRLGVEVVDGRPAPMAGVLSRIEPGDLIVSIPLWWRRLEPRFRTGLPTDVVGVTSTGPCPRDVVLGLMEHGLAGMIEVYGSTETGGIGWRDHPDHEYRLFRHWVLDADGSLWRTDPAGRTYRVEPPDELMARAGGIVVAGRHDHAVQVAGTNVSPSKVAATLLGHPLVAACSVRLMRPDEGDRLKAFIVPEEVGDAAAVRPALRRWLMDTFAVAERPATITFGSELPRNEQGKDADWIASTSPG